MVKKWVRLATVYEVIPFKEKNKQSNELWHGKTADFAIRFVLIFSHRFVTLLTLFTVRFNLISVRTSVIGRNPGLVRQKNIKFIDCIIIAKFRAKNN